MLKRLEIQCVFKELVKDIVVKGQAPDTPAAVRYYVGGLLFCGGGIHPFPGALRQLQEDAPGLAVPCSKVRTCADRHCKISTLLRESLRAWHARPLPHRIAKQAGRQF